MRVWKTAVSVIALAAALAGNAAPARASGDPSPAAASALPELPKLPPITLKEADPASLQEVDQLLEAITSDTEAARTKARGAIAELSAPGIVSAVHQRVQDVRTALDRDAAPKLLDDIRRAGRKALRDKGDASDKKASKAKSDKADKDKSDEAEGDWLDFLVANARPKDKTWRHLTQLVAMERMLAAVGTTPAVRELIQFHAYFGDLLRVDLQRQIAKLKDKAVPALIEARQHDAKVIQHWANRQLDQLGRAIPGEAVASNDPQIVADVLRAYGRTRDVDAVRVILSFCNSDQVHLREAAREAVAAIGEPAIWQLRDVYLNMTGNKPPRDWAWDRIARELFLLYDRARLAEVYKLMDDGVAAMNAKKLDEATATFDKVLARAPLFDRRKEMVPGYIAQAKRLEDDKREEALAMLRKALRLDPKGPQAKSIEAEIDYLEGALLVDQGTPDRILFEKALELDPGHERARAALAALDQKAIVRQSSIRRYAAAGGIGVAAIVAMILLLRRRKDASGPGASPAMPPS